MKLWPAGQSIYEVIGRIIIIIIIIIVVVVVVVVVIIIICLTYIFQYVIASSGQNEMGCAPLINVYLFVTLCYTKCSLSEVENLDLHGSENNAL